MSLLGFALMCLTSGKWDRLFSGCEFPHVWMGLGDPGQKSICCATGNARKKTVLARVNLLSNSLFAFSLIYTHIFR